MYFFEKFHVKIHILWTPDWASQKPEKECGACIKQGFQFRPANGEFRQTFSFNPTQIRQSFYINI